MNKNEISLFTWGPLLFCQQRLKNWELRERKKARDYAKDMEREDERRRETVRGRYICSAPIDLLRVFYLFTFLSPCR